MMKKIYLCENNITGIWSAVYDAWIEGRTQENAGIGIKKNLEQELFCEYTETVSQEKKAIAVEKMIRRNLGEEVYQRLYYTILSEDAGKGNAVWQTMQEARKLTKPEKIIDHLSHPGVRKVFELSRQVGGEAHHYTGFVRFKELANGVLFSQITPKSQVLTCIAEHFANRLPKENWMIYDKSHGTYLIHRSEGPWFLLYGQEVDPEEVKIVSEDEKNLENLWKGFCKSISIEERRNLRLQIQNLPKRFRNDLPEFADSSE